MNPNRALMFRAVAVIALGAAWSFAVPRRAQARGICGGFCAQSCGDAGNCGIMSGCVPVYCAPGCSDGGGVQVVCARQS